MTAVQQGALAAPQITDRHHLVSTLAEALDRHVQRLQIDARIERGVVGSAEEPRALQPDPDRSASPAVRQARFVRFQTVIDLGAAVTVTMPSRTWRDLGQHGDPMVTGARLSGAADSQ